MNFPNSISLFCKQNTCKEQMLKFANKGKFKESFPLVLVKGKTKQMQKSAASCQCSTKQKGETLYRKGSVGAGLAPHLMIAIMFGLFRYLMNPPWHGVSVISSKEFTFTWFPVDLARSTVYTYTSLSVRSFLLAWLRSSAHRPDVRGYDLERRSYKYTAKCHVKCVLTWEWRNNNQHFMASV